LIANIANTKNEVMQRFIFFLSVTFFSVAAVAQIKDPVKWSASSKKKGDSYEVVLTATLPKPWHIYSQKTEGAVPISFKFNKNPLLTFQGNVKEVGKLKSEYDKLFDATVKYYADKVDFVQTVKVKGNLKTNVGVTVEYMTCDDHQCLPPTKKTFNVALN
jgi:thiol:disulfide interchange protein DsbD